MTNHFTMYKTQVFKEAFSVCSTIGFVVFLGAASGLAEYPPSRSPASSVAIPPPQRLAQIEPTNGLPPVPDLLRRSTEGRVYMPPQDSRPPQENHTGGGIRGCSSDVVALAPRLKLNGQSASTRPTFTWYTFSDEAVVLEFQLYRYQTEAAVGADDALDSGNDLAFVTSAVLNQDAEGYVAYTLPPDEPELTVGATYVWQVVVYCGENFDQVGKWTSAEIEVVEVPSDLAAATLADTGRSVQAEWYGAAGLWYDAIAAVQDAETPEEISVRQALLLDLADLEEQSQQATAASVGARLREIAGLDE